MLALIQSILSIISSISQYLRTKQLINTGRAELQGEIDARTLEKIKESTSIRDNVSRNPELYNEDCRD